MDWFPVALPVGIIVYYALLFVLMELDRKRIDPPPG